MLTEAVVRCIACSGRINNPRSELRVLFDISYVPAPDDNPQAANAVLEQMRRIGMKRFLFGSDFNVLTPLQEIKDIEKLRLTGEELRALQQNCAPWVCP
jgi:hypothetical protein